MGCTHTSIYYPLSSHVDNINTNNRKVIVLIGNKGVGKTTLIKSIHNEEITADDKIIALKKLKKECISGILDLYYETLKRLNLGNNISKDDFYDQTEDSITYIRQNLHLQNETMGKHINYLWNLPTMQHTFYNYLFCNSNIHYFFDIAQTIMDPKYTLSYNDYIKVYNKSPINTIYEIDDKEHNIKYIESNIHMKENMNKLSNRNYDCIVYIVALNRLSTNWLCDSVCQFNEIYKRVNVQKQKHVTVILVLNKIDLFKTHLKFRSLKHLFGNKYKGRNFKEKLDNTFIINRILNGIGISLEIHIPIDIGCLIAHFCADLFEDCWLDLCCNDAIKYIQKEFLSAKKDNIYCYQLSAIDKCDTKSFLNDMSIIVNSISM